jgi:hypothetical protein
MALPNVSVYKEGILTMMRYGGAVDSIAKDLGIPEKILVDYIKAEGIDKQLSRRSWKWKSGVTKRRTLGYRKSRKEKI